MHADNHRDPPIRLARVPLAAITLIVAACATDPYAQLDPAAKALAQRNEQMIKKMNSYVGWNIGSFMSDWGLTPTETTTVPEGTLYKFKKQQPAPAGANPAELQCDWVVRANGMGSIVQWSMRGNACPNADGP